MKELIHAAKQLGLDVYVMDEGDKVPRLLTTKKQPNQAEACSVWVIACRRIRQATFG
jgi:hypothetical protein